MSSSNGLIQIINIGNTNIRFALFKNDECLDSWIINTKPYRTQDEYFSIFKYFYQQYEIPYQQIDRLVIGSVVPSITDLVSSALERLHKSHPVIVNRDTPSAVTHHSAQMGTDLYANAVSAHTMYSGTKIVVDFGTALTFIGVGQDGQVLGVVIAPGVNTSLNALIDSTAQLQDIEIKKPKTVLGMNTEHCMQSGIVYGFSGMVEGVIQAIIKDNNWENQTVTVISTGGLGHLFKDLSHVIDVDDKLHTIKGLKILGDVKKN